MSVHCRESSQPSYKTFKSVDWGRGTRRGNREWLTSQATYIFRRKIQLRLPRRSRIIWLETIPGANVEYMYNIVYWEDDWVLLILSRRGILYSTPLHNYSVGDRIDYKSHRPYLTHRPTHKHSKIRGYVHTNTHAYMHVCYVCVHTNTHAYMHVCMHKCIHAYMHSDGSRRGKPGHSPIEVGNGVCPPRGSKNDDSIVNLAKYKDFGPPLSMSATDLNPP